MPFCDFNSENVNLNITAKIYLTNTTNKEREPNENQTLLFILSQAYKSGQLMRTIK